MAFLASLSSFFTSTEASLETDFAFFVLAADFDLGFLNNELKIINCLGFVQGSCCPHYDEEPQRKPSLNKFLNGGDLENCNAIDGGCALHIRDGVVYKSIAFAKKKNAYLVSTNDDKILESPYYREEIF